MTGIWIVRGLLKNVCLIIPVALCLTGLCDCSCSLGSLPQSRAWSCSRRPMGARRCCLRDTGLWAVSHVLVHSINWQLLPEVMPFLCGIFLDVLSWGNVSVERPGQISPLPAWCLHWTRETRCCFQHLLRLGQAIFTCVCFPGGHW